MNTTKKYYLFYFIKSFLFHIPILVLYLNFVLNDPIKVGVLLSIKSISVFLLEIPTGYISDKFGRKISLYFSCLFNILFLIILIFFHRFYFLIIAEIFFSISEALASGADVALIYDNLKFQNKEGEFSKLQRDFSWISSIGLSLSFVIGSYVYNFDKKSVFLLSVLFTLFLLLVLLKIKEYPYKEDEKLISKEEKYNFIRVLKKDINKFKNEKKILRIIIIYSTIIISIFMSIYFYIFPLELNKVFNNKVIYGLIYCLGVILIGLGGKFQKIVKDTEKFIFYGVIALFPIFLISSLLNNSIIIILLVLIMRFFWGMYSTNLNIEINKRISNSDIRATIFSIKNAILNIMLSLFFSAIGLLNSLQINNSKIIGIFLSVLSILIIIISFIIKKQKEVY